MEEDLPSPTDEVSHPLTRLLALLQVVLRLWFLEDGYLIGSSRPESGIVPRLRISRLVVVKVAHLLELLQFDGVCVPLIKDIEFLGHFELLPVAALFGVLTVPRLLVISWDITNASDDSVSGGLTGLLLLVDSEPFLLKPLELPKLTLSLPNNEHLLSVRVDCERVLPVNRQVGLLVLGEAKSRQQAWLNLALVLVEPGGVRASLSVESVTNGQLASAQLSVGLSLLMASVTESGLFLSIPSTGVVACGHRTVSNSGNWCQRVDFEGAIRIATGFERS